jgi:hypothetical protein
MPIGHYRINLDALLARIIYRWRLQIRAALLPFAGVRSDQNVL